MRSVPILSLLLLVVAAVVVLSSNLLLRLVLDLAVSYRLAALGLSALALLALAASAFRAETRARRSLAAVGGVLALALCALVVQRGWLQHDEVPFAFANGDARLRGTLHLPVNKRPSPAVIIAHGSPAIGRRLYTVWAEKMVEMGYAVLVFDKRGTGESTGSIDARNNASAKMLELGGLDLAAAADALARDPRIDRTRIVFVGLSQAGWTVPVALNNTRNVAAFILLSGPTSTTGEENAFSDVTGESAGDDWGQKKQEANDRIRRDGPSGFDPVPYLRTANTRGHWIFGERDASIPVDRSRVILDALIAERLPFSYEIIDGADHLLLGGDATIPDFDPRLWQALARELDKTRPGARATP